MLFRSSVNITSGLSADPAGIPGNITVNTGTYTWNFDYNGTLQLPEGTASISSAANALSLHAGGSESIYISAASGGISLETNANTTIISNVDGVTNYAWTFDNSGNLEIPGKIQGAASYNQPNLLQVNKDDAEWAYGSYASGGDFWMQTKFYGQNQATRGVRFLEAEGSTVVFSVNGLGNAVASGNINAAGSTITGNISSGNIAVTGNISGNTAGYAIGYRDIPQVSFTGDATLAATDAGKHYYSTLSTGNTLTIANNTSVSWSVGTAITVVNRGTGNITIAQGSGVSLYLAGNSTAANRTLTTYGMATLRSEEHTSELQLH